MKEIDKLKEIVQSLDSFREEFGSCVNTTNAYKYLSKAEQDRDFVVSRVIVTCEYYVDVKHRRTLSEHVVTTQAEEYVIHEYPAHDHMEAVIVDCRCDDIHVFSMEVLDGNESA